MKSLWTFSLLTEVQTLLFSWFPEFCPSGTQGALGDTQDRGTPENPIWRNFTLVPERPGCTWLGAPSETGTHTLPGGWLATRKKGKRLQRVRHLLYKKGSRRTNFQSRLKHPSWQLQQGLGKQGAPC